MKIPKKEVCYALAIFLLMGFVNTCATVDRVMVEEMEAEEEAEEATFEETEPVEEEEWADLVIYNDTPYEIQNVYLVDDQTDDFSEDLLPGTRIEPYGSIIIAVPGKQLKLAANILVGNDLVEVRDINFFETGKSYSWSIAEQIWYGYDGSYKYLASYGYLEETYGYIYY